MRKSILLGLCALYFIAALAVAPAQTFDPDPYEPNAQQNAEFRATGAILGLTAPPIGWNCELSVVTDPRTDFPEIVCEPDPLLIEQQERQREEWKRRLLENSRRFYGGFRGRSR